MTDKKVFFYCSRPSQGLTTLVGASRSGEINLNFSPKIIKRQNSSFKFNKDSHKIINWGSTNITDRFGGEGDIYNKSIKTVTNKKEFFSHHQLSSKYKKYVPSYTSRWATASEWLTTLKCRKVLGRKILTGSSGSGIVEVDSNNIYSLSSGESDSIKIYVEYIPKTLEYRVSFSRNSEGDYLLGRPQIKLRDSSVPDDQVNWSIRNTENGFIFGFNEEKFQGTKDDLMEFTSEYCKEVLSTIDGLDFGAIDIIWNKRREKFYVLEVNTAPGIDGPTNLENWQHLMNHMVT